MPFEVILLFFLLYYLRSTVKTFMPKPALERNLRQGQWAVIAVLVLLILLPGAKEAVWLLDAALLWCIAIGFRNVPLAHVRLVLYGILPLVLLSFLVHLLRSFWPDGYEKIARYADYVYSIAITWMIALLVLSFRQKKAFKAERQRQQEELARLRLEAEKKAELEALVQERTRELMQQKEELQVALQQLKAMQAQLVQREKMASLGELTAGIAHEIQNPLNFVNNFSEINADLAEELRQEAQRGNTGALVQLAGAIKDNEQKILYHGKRADAIVKDMLTHSRGTSGEKQPTDLNALVDEYLRLSYHGMRAKDKLFNAAFTTDFDEAVGRVNVVPQDISRVLLNLFNNAFYSVTQKRKQQLPGYEPMVSVRTERKKDQVEICIRDNGIGIPEAERSKIFQPFFTTKPTGEGTGLGLSLSYDIIRGHGGELNVESEEDEGATFVIQLPDVNRVQK